MKNVVVNTNQLKRIIEKNRQNHRAVFIEAQQGYRKQAIKELDAMLKEARDGREIRRYVGLVAPEDHTEDYDRIIQMLEMHVDETIEISQQEFAQFVQDDWGWKAQWTQTTSNYVNQ